MAGFKTRLALVFMVVIVFSGASAFEKTLVVCPTSCAFHSINLALQSAGKGDIILVEKGIYREKGILIRKSVSLIGKNNPVLDGENRKQNVIAVMADHVIIKGFTIENSGSSYVNDVAGVKFIRVNDCLLVNNILKNDCYGVYLAGSSHCIIKNNRFYGDARNEISGGDGIHAWHSKYLLIAKNRIIGQRDGVYFEFVKHALVFRNLFKNNVRYGLHFMFSNHDQYLENRFEENGTGSAIMYSKHILIKENIFDHNQGFSAYGLLLKAIGHSLLFKNSFFRNTTGIQDDECNDLTIKENNFLENGWAVKLFADSSNNFFTLNNFIGNTFDVTYNGDHSEGNRFVENYWDTYRGYDLDKDGIGDVPFYPIKISSVIVQDYPDSAVLLRSLLFNLLNQAEEAFPVFRKSLLVDPKPLMKKVKWRLYRF